jgi:hypothetical protein
MRGNLIPTTVYLDKATKREVDILAIISRKPKAVIMRDALSIGLKNCKSERQDSKKGLLELVILTRKLNVRGPKDLSKNMDKYLWDKYE